MASCKRDEHDMEEYVWHTPMDAAADLPAVSSEVELPVAKPADAALLTRRQALSFGDTEESLHGSCGFREQNAYDYFSLNTRS